MEGTRTMPATTRRYLFYGLKLPLILMLILIGFMMEYLVELPFNVMARLDARRRPPLDP